MNTSFFSKICTFLVLSHSLLAQGFFDETSFGIGMTHNHFRERALQNSSQTTGDFIAKHYRSSSPALHLSGEKIWNNEWSMRMTFDGSYDSGCESENVVGNGRFTFEAHSYNAESRLIGLYQTDPHHKIKIGLGIGVGCFGLITHDGFRTPYTHYGHLIAPILHMEQDYQWLSIPAKWSAQVSGVDFYYFSGFSYTLDNQIVFYHSENIDQAIHIQYNYWDLNLGRMRNRNWMSDYHALSWLLEIKFR